MRREDFSDDAPGELIDNLEGRLTFLPNPLPGPITLDLELFSLVEEAQNKLGRVDGLAASLPDPRIVTQPLLRREAQDSSKIENVVTRYEDLAAASVRPRAARGSGDLAEALRNEAALHLSLDAITRDGRRVSAGLLREAHRVLLGEGENVHHLQPGTYRHKQALLVSGAGLSGHVKFVPPPPHAVGPAMDALIAFLDDQTVPPLIRCAMAHYQFETIHPFADGNGRIGRILTLMLLCQDGLLREPALNPSLHMERNRPDYYRHLYEVSTRNKWKAWAKFFVRSIAAAAEDALAKIDGIRALQARYHKMVFETGRPTTAMRLIDELLARQAVDVRLAAEVLDVKPPTARRHVERLEELGILTEITGRGRDRIYVAKEVIDLIQR